MAAAAGLRAKQASQAASRLEHLTGQRFTGADSGKQWSSWIKANLNNLYWDERGGRYTKR